MWAHRSRRVGIIFIEIEQFGRVLASERCMSFLDVAIDRRLRRYEQVAGFSTHQMRNG
jgi:hypothetical protein